MTDWLELTRRAAFASHRLIGWIYWDPVAIANHAALGIPDGAGYYLASRGASIAGAGPDVVTAAFGSIEGLFVAAALDVAAQHADLEAVARARDAAVVEGLRAHVPEICDELADLGPAMWAVADRLPLMARPLFASLLRRRRADDPLLSAWLAVNCVREWRGDTHWAIHVAEDIDGAMAGLLDAAWRGHTDDWLPRSRGASDDALARARAELTARGWADADGQVNATGVAARQALEDRLERLCAPGWQALGEEATTRFVDLLDPVGDRLVARIDATAGPRWMPAARTRPGFPAA